jgi:spore protease
VEILTLDLALEMQERLNVTPHESIEGVRAETSEDGGITVTQIEVLDGQGEKRLGKPIGNYITIEVPGLRRKDSLLQNEVSATLTKELAKLLSKLKLTNTSKAFIVGLGNRNVTPDALGPLVVDQLVVTRHLFETMPNEVSEGFREVSALAPDVYGKTGVETSDIIHSVTEHTKPDVIICIDALASRAIERVTTTIQITDTGIHPGSGIGNHRKGLDKAYLGVPVIAIGVPTVVYASTIITSAIDDVIATMKQGAHRGSATFYAWSDLPEPQRQQLVRKSLESKGNDLIVTPKMIDEYIEDIANIIATGLNAALHEAISHEQAGAYTH